MKRFSGHIFLLLLLTTLGCVKKAEDIEGPTMGALDIMADESLKDIVGQEEEIFERFYPYARLNISYANEHDMFRKFLADSVDFIITTRTLTTEEGDFLTKRQNVPRLFPFATGAIAFITAKQNKDTTYTYENMLSMLGGGTPGVNFVIENVKSGITLEVLRLINKSTLPPHFYALASKKEVLDYVEKNENAIGIVDYVDISDSDSPFTRDVLAKVNMLGISRPQDSIQAGFVQPFQYNLQDWKYPFTRELYMINNTGKSDVGIGFASFVCGEIGQKIILKAGLLPKYQTERNLEFNNTADIKVVK